MAGRKSKYNNEIVDLICETIEKEGTDKAGYKKAGIHHDTFYTWMVNKPEFSARVAKARQAFSKREDDEVRQSLNKSLRSYATEGLIQNYKNTQRIYVHNASGEKILVKTIEEEKVFNKGIQQWVVEKYQGRDPDELSSIKNLAQAGYFTTEQLEAVIKAFEIHEANLKRILAGDLSGFSG